MLSRVLAGALAATLGACAGIPAAEPGQAIQILALNDLHGNLLPSAAEVRYAHGGVEHRARLGGAARMATALDQLRRETPYSITVAAGDLVGASPLYSAYFLDEPTIAALNQLGLEIASVGNHEFDRGTQELRRLQDGGCEQHTRREPCALDEFAGADFTYLAGNVVDEAGETLFPATSIRDFGPIRVGFIGLTLKDTAELVSPAGIAGFSFLDEAQTANAQAGILREQGADEVVLLIHEGAFTSPNFNISDCPSLSGAILPILEALDPEIRLVVSGHTHNAYVCKLETRGAAPRLLTSAGRYGYFVTDISAGIDPRTKRFTTLSARNVPIVEGVDESAETAGLVERYVAASEAIADRAAGTLLGELGSDPDCVDRWTEDLVADAQLAAGAAPENGGAQVAFINSGGVRSGLQPAADGVVTFGQLFAMQPFGNRIVVLEMTGAQLVELLEQQFCGEGEVTVCHSTLTPSAGLAYAFDKLRPEGDRITQLSFEGRPVDPAALYRVAVNDFLANGGDGFEVLTRGRTLGQAGADIEALEAYLALSEVRVPTCGRVRDLSL